MRSSTCQRAAAALWPPKHEGFVCSNLGALDEGPSGESDFVDVPISQQVDRAMTAEQAILRVEPLADSARRQRVREQHRDLTELGKSVVAVLLDAVDCLTCSRSEVVDSH